MEWGALALSLEQTRLGLVMPCLVICWCIPKVGALLLQHRAFLQQYPAMLATFQADRSGRSLTFGNLTLTHTGLTIPGGVLFNRQGRQLPLPAIQQVRREEGRLVVVPYPGSGVPTVSISHPPDPDDTANLLFYLSALSQGRIACTSVDWQ